ncbi:hypothetical protein BAY61_06160 [Prauserella marina]|uniref:Uncharacterized protein n=1 Tax=Prauserella marina TaxID=530584 RepID=A0A222VL31_9PSEU|nr:hypothetical protein BAY61_06160 [Prauserella marina]PWV85722.1 hypothetical protein DES30_1011752 [Prauserella marina]SDC47344.1 hypothetical protein SAMN05421630_102240 [Prauserella marina]
MPHESNDSDLNHRERATLRAVARGGAELTTSCEPDLFLDGLACCDQSTVHTLARRGLIAPACTAEHGRRSPAILTPEGRAALGAESPTENGTGRPDAGNLTMNPARPVGASIDAVGG